MRLTANFDQAGLDDIEGQIPNKGVGPLQHPAPQGLKIIDAGRREPLLEGGDKMDRPSRSRHQLLRTAQDGELDVRRSPRLIMRELVGCSAAAMIRNRIIDHPTWRPRPGESGRPPGARVIAKEAGPLEALAIARPPPPPQPAVSNGLRAQPFQLAKRLATADMQVDPARGQIVVKRLQSLI